MDAARYVAPDLDDLAKDLEREQRWTGAMAAHAGVHVVFRNRCGRRRRHGDTQYWIERRCARDRNVPFQPVVATVGLVSGPRHDVTNGAGELWLRAAGGGKVDCAMLRLSMLTCLWP